MSSMKSILSFVAWSFLILGILGVVLGVTGDPKLTMPGAVLAGSALIALTLRP